MKVSFNKAALAVGVCVVTAITGGAPVLGQVSAPTANRIPAVVVRDISGTLVGHFAGFSSLGTPTPVVVLDHGSDLVLLEVYDATTLTTRQDVYYENATCSSTNKYVRDPIDNAFLKGMYKIQGTTYAIGKGHVLYRSNGADADAATINSRWDSIGGQCVAATNPGDLEQATTVVDLDTLFNFGGFTVEAE